MNERQRYALTHPITDPDDPAELARVSRRLQRIDPHPFGFLILTTLALTMRDAMQQVRRPARRRS